MQDASTPVAPAKTAAPFAIGNGEQLDFVRLPKKEQVRIVDLLGAFRAIAGASGTRQQAIAAISAVNMGRRGFSEKSLDRLYRDYVESGFDWTVCVRNYRGRNAGQPTEFIKFIGKLVAECRGRTDTNGAVWHRLVNDYWFAGRDVPGYGTFKQYWDATQEGNPYPTRLLPRAPHVPVGWSPRSISRIIARIAPRDGALRRRAAYGELKGHDADMQLYRDRSNLKPLQLVTMDDVELDIQVLFPVGANLCPRTAQAVVALDVATGMIVGYGVRPILTADDMKHMSEGDGRVLTRKDVNAVLMNVILTHGLPANFPMRLLLENASARLTAVDEQMLTTMLPGRIVIQQTRMARREFANSGYLDVHGFPYEKGWLEASFKPLHIRLCHNLGATAPRFDARHETHELIIKEAIEIAERGKKAGVDINRLRFPILTIDEFYPIFERLVEAFNARTTHRLQGFEYVFETALQNGSFARREELPATIPAEELSALKFTRRLESPQERWTRLRAQNEYSNISGAALYPLMQESKRVVSVRRGQIETLIGGFSADKLFYRSPELREYEGRDFIAVFTPDHDTAYLFRADEGFVCAVPRLSRIDITDQTAIVRQSGIVHRDRQIENSRLAEFLSDRDNTYREIRVHNAAILKDNAEIGTAMMSAADAAPTRKAAAGKAAQTQARERRSSIADAARALNTPEEF